MSTQSSAKYRHDEKEVIQGSKRLGQHKEAGSHSDSESESSVKKKRLPGFQRRKFKITRRKLRFQCVEIFLDFFSSRKDYQIPGGAVCGQVAGNGNYNQPKTGNDKGSHSKDKPSGQTRTQNPVVSPKEIQ